MLHVPQIVVGISVLSPHTVNRGLHPTSGLDTFSSSGHLRTTGTLTMAQEERQGGRESHPLVWGLGVDYGPS